MICDPGSCPAESAAAVPSFICLWGVPESPAVTGPRFQGMSPLYLLYVTQHLEYLTCGISHQTRKSRKLGMEVVMEVGLFLTHIFNAAIFSFLLTIISYKSWKYCEAACSQNPKWGSWSGSSALSILIWISILEHLLPFVGNHPEVSGNMLGHCLGFPFPQPLPFILRKDEKMTCFPCISAHWFKDHF